MDLVRLVMIIIVLVNIEGIGIPSLQENTTFEFKI
jgi:hypothetical protein